MQIDNWRLERKFTIEEFSLHKILEIIKRHPAFFYSPYPGRFVNSVYFDTESLEDYYQNVQGDMKRKKIRLRWYGDKTTLIDIAQLEIKIKRNQLGTKKYYPIHHLDLQQDLLLQIQQSALPPIVSEELKFRKEIVSIKYYRSYFLSKSGNIRLTLDSQIQYKKKHHSTIYSPQKEIFVVEIKYHMDHEQEAQKICKDFPFRLSKNSKYINAVEHGIL